MWGKGARGGAKAGITSRIKMGRSSGVLGAELRGRGGLLSIFLNIQSP